MSPLHIGIHQYSVEGALLCFHEIMLEAQRRLGEHAHPKVTMTGLSMADTIAEWDAKDYPALRARSAEVVERLAAAGADFFLCPDNTAHIALEAEGPPLALPGLNIAEVVAGEAERRGYRKVAVLGTNWTMEGPVYPRALEARGIGWAVPPSRDPRAAPFDHHGRALPPPVQAGIGRFLPLGDRRLGRARAAIRWLWCAPKSR